MVTVLLIELLHGGQQFIDDGLQLCATYGLQGQDNMVSKRTFTLWLHMW